MTNTSQQMQATNCSQDGREMTDYVPDWVPQDLRVGLVKKYAIALDSGEDMGEAARQANTVVHRELAFRQARHG
jgi:hypothetical protein